MGCDEAVYAAATIIFFEVLHRWYNSSSDDGRYLKDESFDNFKNDVYIIFYIISMCSTIIYVRGLRSPSLPKLFEKFIPLLYLFDSVGAIGLGLSLFYEYRFGVILSMVVLTNFFLLHILHTLFSKKGGDLVSNSYSDLISNFLPSHLVCHIVKIYSHLCMLCNY